MRSSPRPSLQYEAPRLLARTAPRSAVSSPRYVHRVSPVPASTATTVRPVPAVKYNLPPAMSGVTSQAACGLGPIFCAFQRQTTCRFFTLDASICASGEYRVLPESPPLTRHSPVAGVPCCPCAGISIQAMNEATANADVPALARFIEFPPKLLIRECTVAGTAGASISRR
jgi:hypothetical protein